MIYQKFTTTIGWCRKREFACLCGFRVWHSRNAPLTVTLTTFTLILCCSCRGVFQVHSLANTNFFLASLLLFFNVTDLRFLLLCYITTILMRKCTTSNGCCEFFFRLFHHRFSFVFSHLQYSILMFLIFVTTLLGGILAFVFREKVELTMKQEMFSSIKLYDTRRQVSESWDKTQSRLR